jgi:hypothetical protein
VGLSTTSIDFGASSTSQQVTITNTGGTPMPYTLTTSVSTAILQLNRSGGTLQPGTSHTLVVTVDRSAAPEGDFAANIRVNAGAAGQPVIGVTAQIAPRAPEIESFATDRPEIFATPGCPATRVQVTFTDESDVSGTLFWESASLGSGSTALQRQSGRLEAALPRPFTAEPVEFWVVLTDELGASTESQHRTVTAQFSSTC